jgi:hypothetical protein
MLEAERYANKGLSALSNGQTDSIDEQSINDNHLRSKMHNN